MRKFSATIWRKILLIISFTDTIATRANEISQLIDGLCCIQAITIRFKTENVFDIALINHVERV